MRIRQKVTKQLKNCALVMTKCIKTLLRPALSQTTAHQVMADKTNFPLKLIGWEGL